MSEWSERGHTGPLQRRELVLPAGTALVPLSKLPDMIAEALYPAPEAKAHRELAAENHRRRLWDAADGGQITPLWSDGTPIAEPNRSAVDYLDRRLITESSLYFAYITVAELSDYVAAVLNVRVIESPPVAAGWTSAELDKLMTRKALIDKYSREWPTIERDIKDAAYNGLREAAKGKKHGMWLESKALEWAEARGKRNKPSPSRAGTWHPPPAD